VNLSVLKSLLEGLFWSALGLVLVAVALWALPHNQEFASRWRGSCTGWTPFYAAQYIVVEAIHWVSYCTIAIVLLRLHPILKRVAAAKITLALMFLFILGCGLGHLAEVFCIVNPYYRQLIAFKYGNGVLGYAAAVFIAYSLHAAFQTVRVERAKLEAHLAKGI